jgi:hypothetical protein
LPDAMFAAVRIAGKNGKTQRECGSAAGVCSQLTERGEPCAENEHFMIWKMTVAVGLD